MHGLTLAGRAADDFAPPRAERLVASAVSTGADWVAIAPAWHQDARSSVRVRPDPQRTPPDQDVGDLIDRARAAGLRVMLKPFVVSGDGAARRDFAPSDPAAWFEAYAALPRRYAALAARTQTDLLCVGVELNATEEPLAAAWRSLIAEVRRTYGGPLTYAAGHAASPQGGGYERTPFWDALDVVGVNAYFPLSGRVTSPSQLADAWDERLNQLERWRRGLPREMPIVFTELGYRSASEAAAQPWANAPVAPHQEDPGLQASLYTAFFGIPYRRDALRGVFWWHWNPDAASADGAAFAPNGKPAEQVLRRAYAAAARRPSYPQAG